MFCVYLLEEKCNFIRYYSFINLWYPNLSQSPFLSFLSVGTERTERTGEFSCIPSWYPFPFCPFCPYGQKGQEGTQVLLWKTLNLLSGPTGSPTGRDTRNILPVQALQKKVRFFCHPFFVVSYPSLQIPFLLGKPSVFF